MNNIKNLQNKKEILDLLYSQKKYYKKSELQRYTKWILTIAIFIIGNNPTVKNFIGEKLVVIGAGLGTLIIIYIENNINKFSKIAAATQELIDRTLYGLNLEDYNFNGLSKEDINRIKEKIIKKNRKNYIVIVNSSGKDKPKGVKDWYCVNENLDLGKAIIECQKQNVDWDNKLIKTYKAILLFTLLMIFILLTIAYRNKSVENLTLLVLTLVPLIREIIIDILNIENTININSEITVMINTLERNNSFKYKEIKLIQSKIYNRRQYGFQAPDIIHTIFLKIME